MKTGFDSEDQIEKWPLEGLPHDRTQVEADLAALILESRSSLKKAESTRLLTRARMICEGATLAAGDNLPSLKLEILTELAADSDTPAKRYDLWCEALEEGLTLLPDTQNPKYGIQLFKKMVDFCQDPFIVISPEKANSLLARGKRAIDSLLPELQPPYDAQMLASKASLLRRMSFYQATRPAEIRAADKAVRCGDKACEMSPESWDSFLQLGLCHWHMAQYDKDDKPYHRRLEKAETCLWQSAERKSNVYNMLTLARFFRSTYQSAPFVKCYEQYSLLEHNRRQYHQVSYLYAEGALQLYYGDYPKPMVDTSLEDADRLLEEALDAGYADARHIVDLAFIKAALGEVSAGLEIVKLLHPGGEDTSWTQVAAVISNKDFASDLVAQGFALGINKSSIWSMLGTYAKRFLDDRSLAISMYRTALKLNPSNAVAMTNLSRALLEQGTLEHAREAERWISKAASCADRRFRWWRSYEKKSRVRCKALVLINPEMVRKFQLAYKGWLTCKKRFTLSRPGIIPRSAATNSRNSSRD